MVLCCREFLKAKKHGISPEYHKWESFDPYQEKHEHAWWQAMKD